MDAAFLKIKAMLTKGMLMAYPNHNLKCHIYKDASNYQIGAIILKNKKPVSYLKKIKFCAKKW